MRFQQNVENWERLVSVAVGAALVAAALRQRRPLGTAAVTGAGLLARGASGYCPVNAATGRGRRRDDTREALGGSRGVRVEAHVVIDRPASEVFAHWKNPQDLPLFMRHVERVDVIDGRRSHWVVRGPAGLRFEWDAEVINMIEPELIAWRSLPGAEVATAGSVRFTDLGTATRVTVVLQYDPPGGKAGAALAQILGEDPAADLREDLKRLKTLLELDNRGGRGNGGSYGTSFNSARWTRDSSAHGV